MCGVENVGKSTEEKIGEGLIRMKAMNRHEVDDVLQIQRQGDKRLFGEIALDKGYIHVRSLIEYLKSIE